MVFNIKEKKGYGLPMQNIKNQYMAKKKIKNKEWRFIATFHLTARPSDSIELDQDTTYTLVLKTAIKLVICIDKCMLSIEFLRTTNLN